MGASDHAPWHKVRKSPGTRLGPNQLISWKQKGRDGRPDEVRELSEVPDPLEGSNARATGVPPLGGENLTPGMAETAMPRRTIAHN